MDTRTTAEKENTAKAVSDSERREREHLRRNVDPVFHKALGIEDAPAVYDGPERRKGQYDYNAPDRRGHRPAGVTQRIK